MKRVVLGVFLFSAGMTNAVEQSTANMPQIQSNATGTPLSTVPDNDKPKEATPYTKQINQAMQNALPFDDQSDFEDANKNLVGRPDKLIIKNDKGDVIWDMEQYQFLNSNAVPDTLNPSLMRQAKLNNFYGLYKVTDNIYQIRGYDLSTMSIIQGKTGYIVVDPLISAETAKAGMALVYQYLGKKPIKAVIYSHSHLDHFGGVKGIVSKDEVKNNKIKIIAPKGFTQAAISENVLAGNVMSRRAQYMYGNLLERNAKAQVDVGLGKATSLGTATLIEPTDLVDKTPTKMTIDGVEFVFQYTPDTEAPAEMNFYCPQYKALCMAENVTHTLHNLYTLRGAQVRDAASWVKYLSQSIQLFGKEVQVEFASHHWPMWGNQKINDFLLSQRDMYKFIQDQTLRLANQGYTMTEIAEKVQLPKSLSQPWHNRGYYGSVSHDVKGVYQRYLGWFDANPANLNPLPPVEESKKFVEYMGGEAAVLEKAKQDYAKGDYRWAATALNKVVFANPSNQEAKNWLADTYEQLGYQSENATWRNFYLTGALELRKGVSKGNVPQSDSPDILKAMPLDMLFDFLAIHIDAEKAEAKKIVLNWNFPDIHQQYVTTLNHSVLNYDSGRQEAQADATITINRSILDNILLNNTTFQKAIESGDIKVQGNSESLKTFFGLMDTFNPFFNIVTPRPQG